jgi:transporter family protein
MNQALIISVVATILLWGFMVFLPKLALTELSPLSAIIYEICGGLTVALFVLFFIDGRPEFNLRGASLSYTVGICGFLGTLTYFYAITKGPVSTIATMTAMYPIIAIICGVFFLNETLTIKQTIGIGLSLCGLLLLV